MVSTVLTTQEFTLVTVISIHQLLVRTLCPLWPLWLEELPGLGCYWFSTKKGLTHYTIEVSVNPPFVLHGAVQHLLRLLLILPPSGSVTEGAHHYGSESSVYEMREGGHSRPEDNVDYEIVVLDQMYFVKLPLLAYLCDICLHSIN